MSLTACPTYPCSHTPYHDPEWLQDNEEFLQDTKLWAELWDCFRSPEHHKPRLSYEQWSRHEAKFDRCRHIEEKREEINAAEKANRERVEEEWRRCHEGLAEDEKIIRKESRETHKKESEQVR